MFYESGANTSTVSDVVASAQAATESVRRRYDLTLSFRPSLILVATSAQLQLVSGTISPGPARPGQAGAFSGSRNGRIVLPLDESSDLLDRLLWHELGHVFLREIVRAGQRRPVQQRRLMLALRQRGARTRASAARRIGLYGCLGSPNLNRRNAYGKSKKLSNPFLFRHWALGIQHCPDAILGP